MKWNTVFPILLVVAFLIAYWLMIRAIIYNPAVNCVRHAGHSSAYDYPSYCSGGWSAEQVLK